MNNNSTSSFDDLFNQRFESLRLGIISDFRAVIKEFLADGKSDSNDGVAWLRPQAARDFMGIKSRNAWKRLRQTGEIHYTKIGKEYQYDRQSLVDYKTKRSTLKHQIAPRKQSQSPANKNTARTF